MGLFTRFGHHDVITTGHDDIVGVDKMCPNEQPLKLTPIQNGIEKPLHGAVTAAWARPARQTPHRYPTAHGQQSFGDPSELTQLGRAGYDRSIPKI